MSLDGLAILTCGWLLESDVVVTPTASNRLFDLDTMEQEESLIHTCVIQDRSSSSESDSHGNSIWTYDSRDEAVMCYIEDAVVTSEFEKEHGRNLRLTDAIFRIYMPSGTEVNTTMRVTQLSFGAPTSSEIYEIISATHFDGDSATRGFLKLDGVAKHVELIVAKPSSR